MRFLLALLLAVSASSAFAAEIQLQHRPFESRPGVSARQWLRIRNVGFESINRIEISCTLFYLDRPSSTGGGHASALAPRTTQTIGVSVADSKANRAKCAIVAGAAS